MKYLHLPEDYVLYKLSFAKGLQYQACLISSEGGEFEYVALEEEVEENTELLRAVLNSSFDYDE